MKIRTDFVTNSSSSSFVIATDAEIPERFANLLKLVTKENALDVIKDTSSYEWVDIGEDISDEELQEVCHLTDEQMTLLKLNACGALGRYIHLLKSLEASDRPIYHIFVDRDWLYDNPELSHLIDDAILIEHEGDL